MIEYVGVKTAAEANRIREEFVRENRTRRNIVAIIALCIVTLIAGLVGLNVNYALRENVFYIAICPLFVFFFAYLTH